MQRQLTETETAWLAGLYEGEGSACCRQYVTKAGQNQTYVRVSIAMTDRDVLERVDLMFPSPSGLKVRVRNDGIRKPLFYWGLSRRELVAEFLRTILPFLGERRTAQAVKVLALAEDQNRGTGSQHRRKTHCPQGHPYDQQNTTIKTCSTGGMNRVCKTCNRDYARRRRIALRSSKETP